MIFNDDANIDKYLLIKNKYFKISEKYFLSHISKYNIE